MATTTPEGKYDEYNKKLSRLVESGEVSEHIGEMIFELCEAHDEDVTRVHTEKAGRNADLVSRLASRTKSKATLANYSRSLMRVARYVDLETAPQEEVNGVIDRLRDGDTPCCKDGGLSKASCIPYQTALRAFYRYHTDCETSREQIHIFDAKETAVQPEDLLSRDEIRDVYDACTNSRDRALYHMLLYTGQRNTAVRTIRIKDINLGEGTYKLNTDWGDGDGLKNYYQPREPRPLLAATESVREWLRDHPEPDNPDAFLITGRPKYAKGEPTTPVSRETLAYTMRQLKKKTGIKKPMHPHMMRHNFVSICIGRYNMPEHRVKWLIGHHPESRVMETTYVHLTGEDHAREAEKAWGLWDGEEDENPLIPDVCPSCGEPLRSHWTTCPNPNCTVTFSPDAHEKQQQADDDIHETKGDTARAGDAEGESATDKLKALLAEHPELMDELTD